MEELSKVKTTEDLPPPNVTTVETDQMIIPDGRYIWRIERYKEKMSSAKESNGVLYSPKFYNKQYGYAMRMELLLNGKGQWKDRHVIGCLRVIDGLWDPLLDWPCILTARVVMRDQVNPANDMRKLVKTIGRREPTDPDSESGFYMFIPHSMLTRHCGFTKDNVVFLDIQIKDITGIGSSLSLGK